MTLVRHVIVERDALDLAVVYATLVTVVGVIVAVITCWAQIRKVPEVMFRWELKDPRFDIRRELDAKPVEVERRRPYILRIVFNNVGTGTATPSLLVNVIVPFFITIKLLNSEGRTLEADDAVVSDPPDHRVHFVVARTEEFFPSMDYVVECEVELNEGQVQNVKAGHHYYFGVNAEAVGLTSKGHRLFPSWAHRVKTQHWQQLTWPGRRYRRTLRWVHTHVTRTWLPPFVQPTVRCGPGRRTDRRPFTVSLDPETVRRRANESTHMCRY